MRDWLAARTTDDMALLLLGALLALAVIRSLVHDAARGLRRLLPRAGVDEGVQRGPQSRSVFQWWFSGVGVVAILGLLALTDSLPGARLAAALAALAAWSYLCLLSAWFRNRLLRLKNWYETRDD